MIDTETIDVKIMLNGSLRGTHVDKTAISWNNDKGEFFIRGQNIRNLVSKHRITETEYLLIHEKLPDDKEISKFEDRENMNRNLDYRLLRNIKESENYAHPMNILQTAVAQMGTFDNFKDKSIEGDMVRAEKLFSQIPLVVASNYRHQKGEKIINPDHKLSYVENFFFMTTNKVPSKNHLDLLNAVFTICAEQDLNNSVYTTRTSASSWTDIYSAVTGGIGALKGPRHGGANKKIYTTLEEIGSPSNAENWVSQGYKKKGKKFSVEGYGHAKHKQDDIRAIILWDYITTLAEEQGKSHIVETANTLSTAMANYPTVVNDSTRKPLYKNIELPIGIALPLLGFDPKIYTPIFAITRASGGMAAHYIEKKHSRDPITRPLAMKK